MLRPNPAEALVAREVSTEVNNPNYRCAESFKPVN